VNPAIARVYFVKLRRLTNGSKKFWVGIASNKRQGCEARWNDKYKKLGMTDMAPLYETSSDDFRKNIESLLTTLCEDCENPIDGGGGPRGISPYLVYVVWKK
jgi:hypothetical protein